MKILGVGGHFKVIIEILNLLKIPIESIYDDDKSKDGFVYKNLKVLTPIDESLVGDCIISIGNNNVRKKISEKLLLCKWKSIIHPTAIIAKDVIIGEGSVIMAGAIIQPGTVVGKHVIVNTGACIDHDCILEDFVHVAPNVSMAGGVKVCLGSFIGIGSSIVQNISIGSWSIIGAGSVVIEDVKSDSTVVGNPIRIIK